MIMKRYCLPIIMAIASLRIMKRFCLAIILVIASIISIYHYHNVLEQHYVLFNKNLDNAVLPHLHLSPPRAGNSTIEKHASFSWMSNISSGIPVHELGKVYISFGICCSKEAQKSGAPKETARHKHSNKPYDVAIALASSLWQMHYKDNPKVSIFVVAAYIKDNKESEDNLRNLQRWLKKGGMMGEEKIRIWPYDVSSFSNPYFACLRAGQMGRYYAHESGLVEDHDFVTTTDSDIFPIKPNEMLPFLDARNPSGDYYRVFIADWTWTVNSGRTIPIGKGLGQTAFDWKRSLESIGSPMLKGAIERASDMANSWGFDQTLSTHAITYGQLCHYPSEKPSAPEERDVYTCYKGDGSLMVQCLNKSYDKEQKCNYAHFTPDVSEQMLRSVYDEIVADLYPSDRLSRAAEMVLGKIRADKSDATFRNAAQLLSFHNPNCIDNSGSFNGTTNDICKDIKQREGEGCGKELFSVNVYATGEFGDLPITIGSKYCPETCNALSECQRTLAERLFVINNAPGPFLFDQSSGWNVTSHEEGLAFCKSRGPLYTCPSKSYCPDGRLFQGFHQNGTDDEMWAPAASQGQPVWISVGSINTCIQRGDINEHDKTKVKYIMCCRKEEEEEDHMPDDLTLLRQEMRPGVSYRGCVNSFKKRSCDSRRQPSLPFVSGDFFRCIADVIVDETNDYQLQMEDIECMQSLNEQSAFRKPFLVFVKTDLVHNKPHRLKEIDTTIPGDYILITHNSDFNVTSETEQRIGKLPKLVHWYGQNMEPRNMRTAIPIGLENRHWGNVNQAYYIGIGSGVTKKSSLATANYRPRNRERKVLLEMLKSADFDWVDTPGWYEKDSSVKKIDPTLPRHQAWLSTQAEYKFAISPVGNGIDCHRTWEMILIGTIPVMKKTMIDSIFESLREEGAVLILEDWSQLNRTLLEDHWGKFGEKLVQRHEYWLQSPDNIMLAKHWIHRFAASSSQTLQEKGPLLFDRSTGWNGTSHEEGMAFCKSHAGSRDICPWKAYCPRNQLFQGFHQNDTDDERWAPAAAQGQQPTWVSVGAINTCMQVGNINNHGKAKVKYIMCCHEGEEELADTMPDFTTSVNQTDLSVDNGKCISQCQHLGTEDSIIPPLSQRYCLGRCRWRYRQLAISQLTNVLEQEQYDSSMTTSPPLLEGRCMDLSDTLHYDGVCTSVSHRQKPRINLILSSNSWLQREVDLGLRDCPASQCQVSAGPGHSESSHLYLGTAQKGADPAQIEKVHSKQINAMLHPESLRNTNSGEPIQPGANIDWLASHRQDGFSSSSWIAFSQINADDNHFRIKGTPHNERRSALPVFVRNCDPNSVHSDRARLIAELGKHVDIEQYGRCDLVGAKQIKFEEAYPMCASLPRRSAMWDAQKECVFFHSMFALVVENTYEENYVTEKLYQPLKMGAVPVVMGNSSLYKHLLPDPDAAIFVDDFPDFESAAKYLAAVVKDSSLWGKHLGWKGRVFSSAFSTLTSHSFATLQCDLCDKYAEEVLANSERSWDRSLGLETLDPCIVDILSRHTIPVNLPVINPALGLDAVFVTHYTPLRERKKAMIDRVRETLGVDPIFIEDFNREDLTNEDVQCFGDSDAQKAYINRVAGKGEVSLTMKHFAIYFYMVQHSLDNVLILEDDAAFMHSDWTSQDSYWQKIIRDLPPDYDLVILSGFGSMHNKGEKITDHLYLAQQSRVASMYLSSQKGARNMLRSLPMVSVIDFQMNYAASSKGTKFAEWMTQMPPDYHGPRTVDIKLYHSEPELSLQLEPDGTHRKTATWKE